MRGNWIAVATSAGRIVRVWKQGDRPCRVRIPDWAWEFGDDLYGGRGRGQREAVGAARGEAKRRSRASSEEAHGVGALAWDDTEQITLDPSFYGYVIGVPGFNGTQTVGPP